MTTPRPVSAGAPRLAPEAVTFYTVAEQRFFVGLLALINSLRLTGHPGEIVVLDTGLLPEQRRLLLGHATVVDPPADQVGNPLLLKPFPALLETTGVVVVIDADMIVTRPLDDVLGAAADGRICLFTDETQNPRWFAEWEQAFALQAPLRPGPSHNSGFVAFAAERWPTLLRRWWSACERIAPEDTRGRGAGWEQPFWDGDQDALNALLLSEVPDAAVATWPQHVADLLFDVAITDPRTLACTYRGAPVRLMHHTGSPKPWQPEAWMRVQRNAYVRLLPRLLFASDVAVRLEPEAVPPWLRPGRRGTTLLRALDALNGLARKSLSRLSGGLGERVRDFRAFLVRTSARR